MRRAGGVRTVPVLVTADAVLADSADILDFADSKAAPERRLYPDDPEVGAEIRELERTSTPASARMRAAGCTTASAMSTG